MALSLRLRRALTLSSSILKDRHLSSLSSSSSPHTLLKPHTHLVSNPPSRPLNSLIQSQSFRSSPVSLNRRFDQKEPEIGEDDILFEGCDYNHWLITIDFPKDHKLTAEEMVETYVQTAAKVFGSVEEAKRRIYACSTTTYNGFQCVCDEATSEKFRGLPGVVFILPDSYIDPVNKEYGGDKYENGVITPRPPPIQYGRQGRYGDRNRNNDQPRYNRPNQDGRSFAPQQQDARGFGSPQQDARGFGVPQQDARGYGPPQQDRRGFGPTQQVGRGFTPTHNDGRGFPSPQNDGRGYGPPQQVGRGYGQNEHKDYAQTGGYGAGGRGGFQGEQRDQVPPHQSGFNQGYQGNFPPQEQRNFSQGPGVDRSGSAGNYRQSSDPGFGGEFRQAPGAGYAGDYKQEPSVGHGPSWSGPVEGQRQGKY